MSSAVHYGYPHPHLHQHHQNSVLGNTMTDTFINDQIPTESPTVFHQYSSHQINSLSNHHSKLSPENVEQSELYFFPQDHQEYLYDGSASHQITTPSNMKQITKHDNQQTRLATKIPTGKNNKNCSPSSTWTCPRLKEKSKNAARTRREKENMEFYELAKLLPLPSAITSQLDKASIIRLTTSYLKIRKLFPETVDQIWTNDLDQSLAVNIFQSLIGFVFIVSPQGKIIYVSETASSILGLSQVEMTGNDLSDYMHPDDQEEIKELLTIKPEEIAKLNLVSRSLGDTTNPQTEFMIERRFFLRIKCVLAKRNAGITISGYKVIHCTGNIKVKFSGIETGYPYLQNLGLMSVASVIPVPNPNSTHIRLDQDMFMLRASLELRIIYLESIVLQMTGYHPQDLVEKTLYHLVHPEDSQSLREDHLTLLTKGQVTTRYYRLITKTGGYLWMQSQITIIHNSRSSRPNCVIGINYILKSDENGTDVPKYNDLYKDSDIKLVDNNIHHKVRINKPILKEDNFRKIESGLQEKSFQNQSSCPSNESNGKMDGLSEFSSYYSHIFEQKIKSDQIPVEMEEAKEMRNSLPSEIHDYFSNSRNFWSQELSFINSQYNNESNSVYSNSDYNSNYESILPYASNNTSTTSDSSSLNSSRMSTNTNPNNFIFQNNFNNLLAAAAASATSSSNDNIEEYSTILNDNNNSYCQPPPFKMQCSSDRVPVIHLHSMTSNEYDIEESNYLLTNELFDRSYHLKTSDTNAQNNHSISTTDPSQNQWKNL